MILRAMVALLLWTCAMSLDAHAQQWPSRPITLVSPYPPGGTNDLVGRLFADRLAAKFGQPIVVENRAGAAGIVGSLAVARAAPDGYTLLMANNAVLVIQPLLNAQAKYDGSESFTPIICLAVAYQFVGVNGGLAVASMADLIALAKKSPGKLNYGSAGNGSFGNFSGELLKLLAGIDILHVPYRGSAPAVTDLVSGQVQVVFDPLVVSQIEGGRVKVLGTTAPNRLRRYPEVPTMREVGLPEFDLAGWFGIVGPAGLPKEIAQKIAQAAAEFAKDPEIVAKLETAGLVVDTKLPDEFTALIKADAAKYSDIKQRARIEAAP
jgi:tripartite-type tricarboxylate transporter receptor subunit TctC